MSPYYLNIVNEFKQHPEFLREKSLQESSPDSSDLSSLFSGITQDGAKKFSHTRHRRVFRNLLSAHRFLNETGIIPFSVMRIAINGGEWEVIWEDQDFSSAINDINNS